MKLFDTKHILCAVIFFSVVLTFTPVAISQRSSETKVRVPFLVPTHIMPHLASNLGRWVENFNTENSNSGVIIEINDVENWIEVVRRVKDCRLKQKAAGIILAKPQAVEELKGNDGITRVSQLVSIKNNDVLGGIPSDGYSLPFLRSVPVMYYNTTRLNAVIENHKEFGCSADFPKTWTGEFTVLLGKYRAAIGADAPPPFLISGDQYEWLFETMVYQSGGQLKNQNGRIELNSAIAVNILSQWKNWKEEGLMKIAGNWTATGNHFVYEHFPIICHSSSSMNMIQNSEERNFEYSVEPLPGGAGSRRVLYEGANLYASMYMSPKQKAVAKRFVEFLYAENIQSEIAGNSGYLPCSRTNQTLVSPKVKEQYETNAEPRMIPVHYTDVYEILRGAIWSSVVDGADPKAALDIAQDQVNGLD